MEKWKKKGKRKRWGRQDSCPGYVYVFDIGFDDLYKIGWAKDYRKRLTLLSAANPRLECVCAVKVGHGRREEWNLHWDWWHKHVERELFRLTVYDVEAIFNQLWERRLKKNPKGLRTLPTIHPAAFL
jgi:hypothetical protein